MKPGRSRSFLHVVRVSTVTTTRPETIVIFVFSISTTGTQSLPPLSSAPSFLSASLYTTCSYWEPTKARSRCKLETHPKTPYSDPSKDIHRLDQARPADRPRERESLDGDRFAPSNNLSRPPTNGLFEFPIRKEPDRRFMILFDDSNPRGAGLFEQLSSPACFRSQIGLNPRVGVFLAGFCLRKCSVLSL